MAPTSNNGLVIGEDANDVGASFDLGVQPFQRIRAVNLGSMRLGEPIKAWEFAVPPRRAKKIDVQAQHQRRKSDVGYLG